MGLGDELMALGEAKASGQKCEIVDRNGKRRSHYLWQGADYVAGLDDVGDFHRIRHAGHCRPYHNNERSRRDRWIFNLDHRPQPGEFFDLTPDHRADGYVIVEPHIKRGASPNKQWGQWQQLIDEAPGIPWAQMGPPGTRWLRGVQPLETRDFRAAASLLTTCATAILPEGGLHHAAAALGRTVIVLFGAHTPVQVTGYPFHINLAVDDPEATGWRQKNRRCEQAWKQIQTADVLMALDSALPTPG